MGREEKSKPSGWAEGPARKMSRPLPATGPAVGDSRESSQHELDLRGVPCPLSWAKTKVRLAELAKGVELTVWLDDPRGVRDLPRAAEAEGYAVDEPVEQRGVWRLRIQV